MDRREENRHASMAYRDGARENMSMMIHAHWSGKSGSIWMLIRPACS